MLCSIVQVLSLLSTCWEVCNEDGRDMQVIWSEVCRPGGAERSLRIWIVRMKRLLMTCSTRPEGSQAPGIYVPFWEGYSA